LTFWINCSAATWLGIDVLINAPRISVADGAIPNRMRSDCAGMVA
jgi:hypothetical protein